MLLGPNDKIGAGRWDRLGWKMFLEHSRAYHGNRLKKGLEITSVMPPEPPLRPPLITSRGSPNSQLFLKWSQMHPGWIPDRQKQCQKNIRKSSKLFLNIIFDHPRSFRSHPEYSQRSPKMVQSLITKCQAYAFILLGNL